MDNFLIRHLSRLYNFVTGKGSPSVEKDMDEILELLTACAESKGGEVSARARAAEMVRYYMILDEPGRRKVLKILANYFGPDPAKVNAANEAFQRSIGSGGQWEAEVKLRNALESSRQKILTQFNTINMGVKFLVDLRADLLDYLREDPDLIALERDLKACLTSWFDVGFLELVQLTWSSPAAVLEKLIAYEAVHEVNSWDDLKNRLDSDRRVYAFFHPRMPTEPLIFVQVALIKEIADNVQGLLDVNAPVFDAGLANTAIFYSITNTQAGLRGISFGSFLLKRVIASLTRDFPKLKTFATLSPLPGFLKWLKGNPERLSAVFMQADSKHLAEAGFSGPEDTALLDLLNSPENLDQATLDILKEPVLKAAAYYLAEAKHGDRPADPVARFHLGNGARVERLNWMADSSARGMAQSLGIMVNYLYDPDRLEDNIEAYAAGKVDISGTVKKLAAY